MEQMHSLLKRQFRKNSVEAIPIPKGWEGVIEAVNSAYKEFDADRAMLERSLDLSSQELLRANSEMRAIFQAIPDLFFRFDNDGRILDCKAGGTTDLYLSPEELVGKRIQDVPPGHAGSKFLGAIQQVSESGSMASFEYSLTIHGQEHYYEARLLPLIEDQTIAIIRNITGRKKTEEALRISEAEKSLILNSTMDLVVYYGPDMKIVWANQVAGASVNMTPEELKGRYCWEIWHQRNEPCEGCPLVLARDTGRPQKAEIRSPDGRVWFIRGYPIRDDGGRLFGLAEFCLEITERKRAEEALLDSEQKLKAMMLT